MSDDAFKHLRAAVKDAANGNWEELSKNRFFQSSVVYTQFATEEKAGEWTRERAFFTFLEDRCLG